jgi:hypothetical protein
MTTIKSIAVVLFLCLALCVSASSQEKQLQSSIDSCRAFVGEFYSWYLANDSKLTQHYAGDAALKYRPCLFSPAIVRALRKDEEVQDKAGSDLVSLDADPFAGSDGLAEGYVVGKVTVTNGKCWAEVHAIWAGKEDEMPDVTPELAIKNGSWFFVNFYFASPTNSRARDLLSQLKALREEQKK